MWFCLWHVVTAVYILESQPPSSLLQVLPQEASLRDGVPCCITSRVSKKRCLLHDPSSHAAIEKQIGRCCAGFPAICHIQILRYCWDSFQRRWSNFREVTSINSWTFNKPRTASETSRISLTYHITSASSPTVQLLWTFPCQFASH